MLRRQGQQIVDERGDSVLLRGVGLGNWLLPEGYMWLFGDNCASPREIEQLIERLLGSDEAEHFWRDFRANYITEADIAAIASYGFNSVRLPLNWRILVDDAGQARADGFTYVDRVIEWCRTYDLYVVLDLHAAPGGQTGTNIDDSDGWPHLFTDRRNQELTIALWRMIAERYRDEPAVAGYDLLNEPLPNDHRYRYSAELVALYKELITEIRQVDSDHLIILEGTHWSNDWTIFTELWDDQVVLQFHKYWNPPDRASIQPYLDVREQLDVPIWLGESGENNLAWYQGTFSLCDELRIGWNFWQWKKLDSRVSPVSIPPPSEWGLIQAAADDGESLDGQIARGILQEFLDNLRLSSCISHPEVVNAIMRRVPIRLYAEHFAHAGNGASPPGEKRLGAKRQTGLAGFRETDGISIGFAGRTDEGVVTFPPTREPAPSPENTLEVRLDADEWVAYRIEVPVEGGLVVRLNGEVDESAEVSVAGAPLTRNDAGEYSTVAAIAPGRHELRVKAGSGSAALQSFDIALQRDPSIE